MNNDKYLFSFSDYFEEEPRLENQELSNPTCSYALLLTSVIVDKLLGYCKYT